VPSWTIVTVIFTYITYSALAIRATPAFNEIRTITGMSDYVSNGTTLTIKLDSRAAWPSHEDGDYNPYIASAQPNAIPEIYDIPIGLVNRVVYRDAVQTARSRARRPDPPP
jgi:phosphatidylinositol glycan class P protein